MGYCNENFFGYLISFTTFSSVITLQKTGKWNAMHVRIAWEVYHHQQKEAKGGTIKPDLLRTPSHLFPPGAASLPRSHEMPFAPSMNSHRPPPTFEQPHSVSLFGSSGSHMGMRLQGENVNC